MPPTKAIALVSPKGKIYDVYLGNKEDFIRYAPVKFLVANKKFKLIDVEIKEIK